jgi:hypothetical protein
MGDILQAILDAWLEIFLFLPRHIFSWSLSALEYAIDNLPVIDIVDPATLTSGFTGDLVYFLSIMEFDYGMGAVSTALMARFVLRRIPLIG